MSTEPGKVLVIDDDATQRVFLAAQLDDAGHDVHVAVDGLEGLERTRDLRPDLVLCDWVMPRLDGIDYCRSVKSDPELRARVRAGLRLTRLQRELVEAQHRAALLELAATLGHELNNPLTALLGHMELVLQYVEQQNGERIEHHTRQASQVCSRIADVAHRLASLHDPRTKTYLDQLRMLDLD